MSEGSPFDGLFEELAKAIVGKKDVIEKVLVSFLAQGHLLIEDYPGMAKTLLASSFAAALDLEFKRIQFTPDLLPQDITGGYYWDVKSGEFKLRKGPIFTNILLADEINRAPPKTQSALLEAMQERQVTIEGNTIPLNEPFMVIATLNPIEYEGTYPLPEAQLDRFIIKTRMGYPDPAEERLILRKRIERRSDKPKINKVLGRDQILAMQRKVEDVYVDDAILDYIVRIASMTREAKEAEVGVSPRGSEALLKASRALALIRGRDYVIPDDVKELAIPVLAHRLVLRVESVVRGSTAEEIIRHVLEKVEVPRGFRG
ncbi:MAG: AAA family ATPase [Infirmifilum sp.]|jgi:MoxR-like ATPase|uniref:Magnesium chelatase n=1 Tax=Infirmifilum uzonense TaxID=1550241 RepID=A0A0F7FGX2_9CREN|nr:MoxR family ATPase [Infirmifilum uzonense]AKG38078.1 magnesium chelatase [Infirmifilum uzonense]